MLSDRVWNGLLSLRGIYVKLVEKSFCFLQFVKNKTFLLNGLITFVNRQGLASRESTEEESISFLFTVLLKLNMNFGQFKKQRTIAPSICS